MEYLELTRINGCEESLVLDNCRPFKIITEKLSVDSKKVILDLGKTNNDNVNYFSEFFCKIYIEDLFDAILQNEKIEESKADDDNKIPEYNKMFYCDSNKEKADIIFCWELLNYIPKKHVRLFIETLLKFSKKDTLFHAFIATQATPQSPLSHSFCSIFYY